MGGSSWGGVLRHPPSQCMLKSKLKCMLKYILHLHAGMYVIHKFHFRANSLFSLFLQSFPLQSESGRSFYRQGHAKIPAQKNLA